MHTKQAVRGFTLIELMIVIAILSVFMVFMYQNIMNTQRIAAMEDVRLDLDSAANLALRRISNLARDAVLPVRPRPLAAQGGVQTPAAEFLENIFQTNGPLWEKRLANGANFLVFSTPIDADGSGDLLDADLIPYLGISHPHPFTFTSGGGTKTKNEYTYAYGADLHNNGNVPLAYVNPDNDIRPMGTPPSPVMTVIPGKPPTYIYHWINNLTGAVAVIHFEPLMMRDGTTPVTVHEGEDVGGPVRGLNCDINGDGRYDPAQQYYLGNVVISYPGGKWGDPESGEGGELADPVITRLGMGDTVAVPVVEERGRPNWDVPLFSLVTLKSDGSLVDNSSTANADNIMFDSLRIHLTLLNYHDRDSVRAGDPDHPGGSTGDYMQNKFLMPGTPGKRLGSVQAKRYESIVRLRNL